RAEAVLRAGRSDLAVDSVSGARLFKRSKSLRLALVIATVDDGDCVRGGFSSGLRHVDLYVRNIANACQVVSFGTCAFKRLDTGPACSACATLKRDAATHGARSAAGD